MKSIVLYLHMHQPWRVRHYTMFDIGQKHDYFGADEHDRTQNHYIFDKVADKSYRPMLRLLLELLQKTDFKVSLSITGTFLEQALEYRPDIVELLKQVIATGKVAIVAETYYHSMAFFYSVDEFKRQVEMHAEIIERLFGRKPDKVFRNTELAYNDALGQWADAAGYDGILAEGWDRVLEWRSAGYLYRPPETKHIKLLLKNYRLSDDLAFRFSNKQWSDYPLTVEKYLAWCESAGGDDQLINLFMDFETFGEHQWADTGIFNFFEHFVKAWLSAGHRFLTVEEAATWDAAAELPMPYTVTWADTERDLTAWLGNAMQHETVQKLYALEQAILKKGDINLIADWRKLQTSDHLYYICTKYFNDGDVHAYFSAYDSPYDAFLYIMNALRDLDYRASS